MVSKFLKTLTVISFAAIISTSSAQADVVTEFLQFDGSGNVAARWIGNAPQNVQTYVWTPTNGDQDLNNYKLQDGQIVYSPIAPKPVPDPVTAENNIWNDASIPVPAKMQLALFFPLINQNLSNPVAIQQGWAALIQLYAPSVDNPTGWLTTDLQALVQNYCSASNIKLVGQ